MSSTPRIGLTMGDPAGVGPEIVVKALAEPWTADVAQVLVIGDHIRLGSAARIVGVPEDRITVVADPRAADQDPDKINVLPVGQLPADLPFGEVSPVAGEAAYQYIERAASLATDGEIDAICTAPINKKALHEAGRHYAGHTELLAELTGTPEVSMMLQTPKLRVIHVTTHVGLKRAIENVDPGLVLRTIQRGAVALEAAGIASPRIGVCAINPHAGDGGIFGENEEESRIQPGIDLARERGIDAVGPLPADTAFLRAAHGDFDLIVAMYHDQGHIPIKVTGIDDGVNITVGLPVIRTSVDHGTAFDIAGTGTADERAMIEAIRQAASMARRRK